jgi:hypothetical protein
MQAFDIHREFEDTKGVTRIHISKKNIQHNGQKKKYKGQTTITPLNMIELSLHHWDRNNFPINSEKELL